MIDHLVLATPDVDATSAQIQSQWGVAVVAGGSHTGRGAVGPTTIIEVEEGVARLGAEVSTPRGVLLF